MTEFLIFSKFSTQCHHLITNLPPTLPFNKVCIDNETVRNTVLNDGIINLQFVPTILVLKSDGVVEKYEGIQQ